MRFLEVAAQSSGQLINYAAIGQDCQVDQKAVARYYQILEDTLLGVFVPAFHLSVRKQQSTSPRFYLFDLGIQRALRGALNVPVTPQSYEYGRAFEQFLILEVVRLNSYHRTRYKLSHLRTKDDAEVDLIIERPGSSTILMEIKSSSTPTLKHARHIALFQKDLKNSEAWLVSQDSAYREEQGVKFLPWQRALLELFPREA
jgi:predicted AAA+ superfamily ATPase